MYSRKNLLERIYDSYTSHEDDTAAGVGGCAAAGDPTDPTGPGVGVDADAGDDGAADRVLF